jgi:hypothetical protein
MPVWLPEARLPTINSQTKAMRLNKLQPHSSIWAHPFGAFSVQKCALKNAES